MRCVALILTFLLCACGSSGGGDASSNNKELFSSWINKSDPSGTLDLTGLTFGAGAITYHPNGISQCVCNIFVSGSEAAGTAELNNCAFTGSGTNYCPTSITYYDFTNVGGLLTLCLRTGGGCSYYE